MATSKQILVVDDDSYVRESTEEILRRKGYQVDTSANGKDALVRLDEADFDLILSDIKMPEMDGIELLAAAKGKYPDIHVIMMTAFGSVDNAVEAMRKGAYDYIQKGSADPTEIERSGVSRLLTASPRYKPHVFRLTPDAITGRRFEDRDVVRAPTHTSVVDAQSGEPAGTKTGSPPHERHEAPQRIPSHRPY